MKPLEKLSVPRHGASEEAGPGASSRFLVRILELEVPEVRACVVTVKRVARHPPLLTKVAVASRDPRVDPVAAVLGPNGARLKAIRKRLGGERVDVIEHSDDLATLAMRALKPARPLAASVPTRAKAPRVDVVLAPHERKFAIGKGGINLRLASELVGGKISLHSRPNRKRRARLADLGQSYGIEAQDLAKILEAHGLPATDTPTQLVETDALAKALSRSVLLDRGSSSASARSPSATTAKGVGPHRAPSRARPLPAALPTGPPVCRLVDPAPGLPTLKPPRRAPTRRPEAARSTSGASQPKADRHRGRAWRRLVLGLVLCGTAALSYELRQLPSAAQMRTLLGHPTMMLLDSGADWEMVLPVRVRLYELPEHLVEAVIEMEDRRFYSHPGVDAFGLGRAALGCLRGLARGTGCAGGGSSITQQLVRNYFLNGAPPAESPSQTGLRKLREIVLALRLERAVGKREILELYLNRVYFGRGAYGIEQAAATFFGVPAGELTRLQAAMLVGLLPRPEDYNPTRDLDLASRRAELVLATLTARGKISEAEANDALLAAPRSSGVAFGRGSHTPIRLETGYFRDWLLAEVESRGLQIESGDRLFLTLDPQRQRLAEQQVRELLLEGRPRGVGQGALLALSPGDGAVHAMVGGRSFAERQLNRTTQDPLAPASTIKPFVFLAALEQGYSPGDLFVDAPLRLSNGALYPRNFDRSYRGRVTLTEALAHSLNAATVQVAHEIGYETIAELLRRVGFTTDHPTEHMSLPLGTTEVTMLELARAYATLANGGHVVEPHGLVAIVSRSGRVRYRRAEGPPTRAARTEDIALLNGMLRKGMLSGTGRRANFHLHAVGKTGTGSQYRDAWFIGYSAHLVAAVWVGNDDRGPMLGVAGSGLPAQHWGSFMSKAHHNRILSPLPGVPLEVR